MTEKDYTRQEPKATQLDRNWAELVQELRVIGTGVQILFAFLLSIAFQARFEHTDGMQRSVYLVTLMLAALATALLITPVAIHRLLFRAGVKDEVVDLTNALAVAGLGVLSLAMIGSVLLVSDWVGGVASAVTCTALAAVVFVTGWAAVPLWLRGRAKRGSEPAAHGPA